MDYSALMADQAKQADEDRTKRAFIGFLSSVLGVDQTMNGADSAVGSAPGQYVIADNPNGNYSVQGQPRSNLNTAQTVAGVPVGFLLIAGLAYMLLK